MFSLLLTILYTCEGPAKHQGLGHPKPPLLSTFGVFSPRTRHMAHPYDPPCSVLCVIVLLVYYTHQLYVNLTRSLNIVLFTIEKLPNKILVKPSHETRTSTVLEILLTQLTLCACTMSIYDCIIPRIHVALHSIEQSFF